jgi:hypothetical protein
MITAPDYSRPGSRTLKLLTAAPTSTHTPRWRTSPAAVLQQWMENPAALQYRVRRLSTRNFQTRRLGGSPRIVVLDNLREGVLSPDFYDPGVKPLYRDVLAHYGVTALPCKVRDPDQKGKVESGVNHAQMTPLKGKKFESLEEAQAYLDHWEERWADTRIHGRTKRQVAAMFAEEKPHLQPLPLEPFRYYQYGERTVHLGVRSGPRYARRVAGGGAEDDPGHQQFVNSLQPSVMRN